MLVVRPIARRDFDDLMRCAEESGHGFTSLPMDTELIAARIEDSIAGFLADAPAPNGESYLMVAEDLVSGEIAGITGIESAIGLTTPFYTYQLNKVVHHSRHLNIHNVVEILSLGNNYTGATEICTLFLREKYRHSNYGKLLSKIRFLMMAQFPEKFSELVFAEMRGVSDENGQSPFWGWLQQHFFSIDFIDADYLSGTGQKDFIAELMPKLPIYVNLLSDEARAVIGQVHEKTRPALRLLEQEGFRCRGYVDIFDAGPTLECGREQIDAIRRSFTARVQISNHHSAQEYLMANTDFSSFRGTLALGAYDQARRHILISQKVADALAVTDGDWLRLVTLQEAAQ